MFFHKSNEYCVFCIRGQPNSIFMQICLKKPYHTQYAPVCFDHDPHPSPSSARRVKKSILKGRTKLKKKGRIWIKFSKYFMNIPVCLWCKGKQRETNSRLHNLVKCQNREKKINDDSGLFCVFNFQFLVYQKCMISWLTKSWCDISKYYTDIMHIYIDAIIC